MKVAQHAKRQTERSMDSLYSYTDVPRLLANAKRVAADIRQAALPLLERPMYYRLNADHSVSPIRGRLGDDSSAAMEWARQYERWEDRILKQDTIEGCLVSTIFLGLDHGFRGPPELFETMAFTAAGEMRELFGGKEREVHEELEMRRYSTYAEAMKGHEEVAAHVRATVAHLNAIKGKGE